MVAIIQDSLVYDFLRDSVAFDAASGGGNIRFWVSRKTLLALNRTNIEHADDLLSEFERHSGLIQVAAVWKLNAVQTGEGGIELTSDDLAKVTHILPSNAG
jgi:uncharacterized protein DUF1488